MYPGGQRVGEGRPRLLLRTERVFKKVLLENKGYTHIQGRGERDKEIQRDGGRKRDRAEEQPGTRNFRAAVTLCSSRAGN